MTNQINSEFVEIIFISAILLSCHLYFQNLFLRLMFRIEKSIHFAALMTYTVFADQRAVLVKNLQHRVSGIFKKMFDHACCDLNDQSDLFPLECVNIFED